MHSPARAAFALALMLLAIACGSSSGGVSASTDAGHDGPTIRGAHDGGPKHDVATHQDAPLDGPLKRDGGHDAYVKPDARLDGSVDAADATAVFTDFPSDPIVDTTAPSDSATLFATDAGASSGGPCLFEPEPDALFPSNWVRPRFNWSAGTGQNLFELRLHTPVEANDLVVYTATAPWTMPKTMWTALATHARDTPITITLTGAVLTGGVLTSPPAVGSVQTMTIAPTTADGTIVYWSSAGGSSLQSFAAGDEAVALALQPSQVQMQTVGGAVTCVGCHTSTPDGDFAGLTAQGPWGNVVASVQAGAVGAPPSFLGVGAIATLTSLSPLGIQTYSKAHWGAGDHVMIAPLHDSPGNDLAWFDLEATTSGEGTSYGVLARTGDTNDVGSPTFSHDGSTIVYVSTNAELTGRLDTGTGALYAVPYNGRAGGAAVPVPGGSDPARNSYYPAFSPDDAYLAFNQVPANASMYNNPLAEVFVVPSAGGTPTRLEANDPPACLGTASPGVTNSWPRWSPAAKASGSKTYYWIVFSSTRDSAGITQIYVTGVAVNGGTLETHGSIHAWNQVATENNHTPAWDVFQTPPVP